MSNRRLDDVLSDLQRTRAALEDATDPEQRARISETLDRLRSESREMLGDPLHQLSSSALAQRIARCELELDTLAETRLNIGQVGGGSGLGGGLDPLQTIEHNAMVDRQGGRAELERNLKTLRAEQRRRAQQT